MNIEDTDLGQNNNDGQDPSDTIVPKKELSDIAKRALAEAKERQIAKEAEKADLQKEYGGRGGQDPSRFGDWEIDGRAIDF